MGAFTGKVGNNPSNLLTLKVIYQETRQSTIFLSALEDQRKSYAGERQTLTPKPIEQLLMKSHSPSRKISDFAPISQAETTSNAPHGGIKAHAVSKLVCRQRAYCVSKFGKRINPNCIIRTPIRSMVRITVIFENYTLLFP